MSGEQITLVALLALVIVAVLISLAMLTKKKTKGTLELPFGFKLVIEAEGEPSPTLSGNLAAESREAVKAVIWQHNANFAAVLNGEDVHILEQTTTQGGFVITRNYVEHAKKEDLRSYSIAGGELRDIKWLAFDVVDTRTIRVTADEIWEWLYNDNRRVRAVARNAYVTKRLDGNWRIDYSEIVNR